MLRSMPQLISYRFRFPKSLRNLTEICSIPGKHSLNVVLPSYSLTGLEKSWAGRRQYGRNKAPTQRDIESDGTSTFGFGFKVYIWDAIDTITTTKMLVPLNPKP